MTSADFLQFSRMSPYGFDGCHYFVLRRLARPPPLRTATFLSYICCIYTIGFGQYWTSLCLASSSALYMPSMQFLFVRPRVCYGLTSYSTSRWTHLPFANSSYCQACSGLSPPSYCPFGANHNKTRNDTDRSSFFCLIYRILQLNRLKADSDLGQLFNCRIVIFSPVIAL